MREAWVLLVRHPETEANVNGRFVGRGGSPYTHEGRRQLARVPRKVARFGPEVVYSSPLARAYRLAEKSASLSRARLVVDDRIVEIDFGDVEGMTYEELSAAGIEFNYRNREEPVAPGGESRAQVEARVAALCDQVVAAGERAAIVCHGGSFRASLVHLLGLCSTDIWAFHINNAQLAEVHVVDGHGTLERFVQG